MTAAPGAVVIVEIAGEIMGAQPSDPAPVGAEEGRATKGAGEGRPLPPASARTKLVDNVVAARNALASAETELDRVIGEITVTPRVEKRVVSETVATAIAALQVARKNLEDATQILEEAPTLEEVPG